MKILVLNGSPKTKSDTMAFTGAFLKGLNQNGNHQVKIISLIEKKLKPCRGCFECLKAGNCQCIIQDDQNGILEEYVQSEIIIWSFPLYVYGMPGHVKTFLDRTIPLLSMKMEASEGGTRHLSRINPANRHNVVISGCGFPNFKRNFEGLKIQMKLAFSNLTAIYVPQAPLMNIELAKPVAEPKAKAFELAGIEYAKNLSLSARTVNNLQTPMIPEKDYLAAHNSSWD